MQLTHAAVLRPGVGLIATLLFFVVLQTTAWVQDVQPKMYFQLGEETPQRFLGNESHKDHFKLLEKDQGSLLVGARNIVYNISLRDLTEFTDQRIEWHSSGAHRELCYLKGKSEDDCQNYVRVLAKIAPNKLLICGTNAYKPLCRHYHFSDGDYVVDKEYEGRGLCPYDPDHNSTGVYSDGQLYTATVADFSGTDPLIYREPLRTERSDLKQLNAPNFVSSMEYEDFIFFFFRETAVEYINFSIIPDDGKVIKALNVASFDSDSTVDSVVVEELQVLPPGVPVKNLYVVHVDSDDSKLVVVSDDEILSIKLHRCDSDKITSCRECVALQDPYCAWDTTRQQCAYVEASAGKKKFVQSVTEGEHSACGRFKTGGPGPVHPNHPATATVSEFDNDIFNNQIVIEVDESNKIPNTLAEINQAGSKLPSSQEKLPIYTAETLSIAVATSCLAALAVGFVSGFLFSRRCRGDDYNDMPYPDQRHQLNRLTEVGLNANEAYLSPCANNKSPINLVLNVPPKNANGKNANSSAENKPIQKVKKTYI